MSTSNIKQRLKRIEDYYFGGSADDYREICFNYNLRRVGDLVLNETIIALIEGGEYPPILADKLYAPIPRGTPKHIIEEAEIGADIDVNMSSTKLQNTYRKAIEDRRTLVNIHKKRIKSFVRQDWTDIPEEAENWEMIEWIEATYGPVEPEEETTTTPVMESKPEDDAAIDRLISDMQNPTQEDADREAKLEAEYAAYEAEKKKAEEAKKKEEDWQQQQREAQRKLFWGK